MANPRSVLSVIQRAYRRSGVLAASQVVNATQKDVGLELLQDMYREMGEGLFGRVEDVYLTDDTAYAAEEFQRVTNPFGASVTLPVTVSDPDHGIDRVPLDGAIIIVTRPATGAEDGDPGWDGEPIQWVYDANRAEWQNIASLLVDDNAPLCNRWSEAIISLLAARIANDVGVPIDPYLAKRAGTAKMSIATRYGSAGRTSPLEFF